MKFINVLSLLFILTFTACQATPPEPITGTLDSEFTLAPNQIATIKNTGLRIRLVGIASDERCPSEIECVMSGPVSLSISIQKDAETPLEFDLQTFTSNDGRAPERSFEGIENLIEHEGFIIQVKSVLPYPARSFDEIKDTDYRVAFLVTEK